MDLTLIIVLSGAVLLFAVLRAAQSIRHHKDSERGSDPGTGYHEVEANYHSGGAGGGHSYSFKVPRDPQEYAKTFVPRNKRK
ncbi:MULTISPECIES: hypothetical protein [Roseobacteraceae]|uniref:Uncharacterized protein n=1 Tax=Pseudosulfitobacter pseudonitzschiae TaxID=1402135 RepID=A0A073JJF4_9RHOB|nr:MULTISPECIES: hypothetical protein [Roseobacteraceae]KEJ97852.1 hypothetical protein SUH3_02380 [Pseudosulfitobacter pseudonitzschiae]MBM1814473.1 hypothetical protein [Pseudosulfitobacter pseudonitzschiae]MBM1831466.1 hypothetical protein [Pseudosulfitobacter pseudonitzschiae]MBM1836333.1 hypothetical protein [Pseudosulfitobacter pseudonitzschiae]MBM1841179.1 hypothetical protein [Pseudosulfitobacter pseudonitzschiae]|tara:strand:+ start:445 stop:690 length:246 start_codon:yes stop_codon:yes gene_type:complete